MGGWGFASSGQWKALGKDGKGRQAGCGHTDFPQQPKGSAKDALRGSFVSSSEFESVAFEGATLVAHMVKNLPAERETRFDPWVGKIPWRREWQPTPVFLPGKSGYLENRTAFGIFRDANSYTFQMLIIDKMCWNRAFWVIVTFTLIEKTVFTFMLPVNNLCITLSYVNIPLATLPIKINKTISPTAPEKEVLAC